MEDKDTTVMLSGIRLTRPGTGLTTYQYVSDDDERLTHDIMNCGGNKTRYKMSIIELFKRYIDPSAHVCTSCSSEVILAWKKYLLYYEKNNKKHRDETEI